MIEHLHEELKRKGLCTFRVKVRPNAAKTRFRGPLGEDTFKVDVAAIPEDGKANEELVSFLAEEFGVKKGDVEIISGQTNPMKIVRISEY